jgi:hypothetical protein
MTKFQAVKFLAAIGASLVTVAASADSWSPDPGEVFTVDSAQCYPHM